MDQVINTRATLIIKDKKALTLDGVKHVLSFEEDEVTLDTELGRVIVEGQDLKIESLSKEGEILIVGKIDGAFYSSREEKGGLFGRLFR